MAVSRREFIRATAASAASIPLALRAQSSTAPAARLFRHGVASGDPLTDQVILWTRVTPREGAAGPVEVRWRIAADERLSQIVASGTTPAVAARDFAVKVDAAGLRPGHSYFYAFDTGGEESPVGRTRTLPAGRPARLRLASVSCSNYPAGFFNVYRCLANRPDLDAVVHLGDYIYELADAGHGGDTASGRVPMAAGEAATLADYRNRYATYRTDVDLQDVHRLHPFIAVWDDHEIADNASVAGAPGHSGRHGSWQTRRAEAYQAYLEWMPIREAAPAAGIRLYRTFRFGDLADLVMLDTRGLRDPQVSGLDASVLADPRRSLLGAAQEAWLHDELRASRRENTRWRVIGQQVLFSPVIVEGVTALNTDVWDGYPAARQRVLDMIASERVSDLAILTGDVHSSWALDVPGPAARYDATTGAGSAAIELVAPAVSSPPLFAGAGMRDRADLLRRALPHLKYLDGDSRGYVLLDISRDRLQAEWYFVPNVSERSPRESKATAYACERGSSRLTPA